MELGKTSPINFEVINDFSFECNRFDIPKSKV